MGTVTTYTRLTEVAGSPVVENGKAYVHDSANADAFTLPANAPVGFTFFLHNIGAGAATLTAPAGETMDGATTTIATNESVIVTKSSATVWVATAMAGVDA